MKIAFNTPKQHVPSGSFVTSRKKNMIIEAYLGTCVGVTLCDGVTGVGGLIHLLLPEPSDSQKPWKAEIYAKTGLPLFIKALCDAGAKKHKLEACVAGGAFVGPVSKQDLDLDIGGKTTEIVHTILKDNQIPINKTETGGYFSCRLILDLNTLKSSIEPFFNNTSPAPENFKKPTFTEIGHMINRVKPIPQIALKMSRMINNEDYNMLDIAAEIKQDQILSSKVIRLCNSSFIGLRSRIDSIDRALIILGEKMLLQLVLTASMELFMHDTGEGYSQCKGGLFQHSLGTAIASEELAKYTGKTSPEIAYTAGLLHDIGKIVLDQYISSIYPFFYRKIQTDGIEMCEVENEKLGITHTEAGGLLADNWSFPEKLTDVIRHHHYPEKASVDVGLSHLIYLADLLMSRFQVGQVLECLNTDNIALRLKTIGIDPPHLPLIIDIISRRLLDYRHKPNFL